MTAPVSSPSLTPADVAEPSRDDRLFFHASRSPDACDHDFKGWREIDGGRGGETVCAKCGMGALEYTLKRGDF